MKHALCRILTVALALAVLTLFFLSNAAPATNLAPVTWQSLLLSHAIALPLLLLPTIPWFIAGGKPLLRRLIRWRAEDAPPLGVWPTLGLLLALIICAWTLGWLAADGEAQATTTLLGGRPFWQTLILIPFVCGLGPLAEELLCRGALLESLPRHIAVPVSAALFAYAHGPSAYLLPLFFVGFTLALLTRRQGALLPAILLHGLFNLPALLTA